MDDPKDKSLSARLPPESVFGWKENDVVAWLKANITDTASQKWYLDQVGHDSSVDEPAERRELRFKSRKK